MYFTCSASFVLCACVYDYSYVSMFCARFPLAGATAFAANVVEIRFDAHKFLTSRRSFPQLARDIGVWFPIMQLLSLLAVISNCTIIYLSTTPANDNVDFTSSLEALIPSLGAVGPLLMFVIMEHFLVMLKWVLRVLTPDTPTAVISDKHRERYGRCDPLGSIVCALGMCPSAAVTHCDVAPRLVHAAGTTCSASNGIEKVRSRTSGLKARAPKKMSRRAGIEQSLEGTPLRNLNPTTVPCFRSRSSIPPRHTTIAQPR